MDSMNWLDIVILIALGVGGLSGIRMGGVHAIMTTLGVMTGILLASRYHDNVEPYLSKFIDNDNAAYLGGFAVIFLAVLVSTAFIASSVRALLRGLALGWMDKTVGLALALGVVMSGGSAILSTAQDYPILGLDKTIEGSILGSFLADNFEVILKTIKIIPAELGV